MSREREAYYLDAFNRLDQDDAIKIKWNDYIPHTPFPKQYAVLLMNGYLELFFGGAAGGGKSDLLLMAALQYVDTPGYSALLLRKRLTDLEIPGNLLFRAHSWLDGMNCGWDGKHRVVFPSGASIQFGYLEHDSDKYRYQGTEFQFIGFDELTQFFEEDYTFMFSRCRKKRCPYHNRETDLPFDENCRTCLEAYSLSKTPLRIRATSNPGGFGHDWVRKRFDIQETTDSEGKKCYRGLNPNRPYIPSYVRDNPALDPIEYEKSLTEMDPVTREQMLRGDWGISKDGRIRRSWLKNTRYSITGVGTKNAPSGASYVVLGSDGHGRAISTSRCRVWMIVDPAASARSGPGDKEIWANKQASWTVISTWLVTPDHHLILWNIIRIQKEIPEIIATIRKEYSLQKPEWIGIENTTANLGVLQSCTRMGMNVKPISTRSQDKLTRATDVINRMEQQKVWLPQQAAWLSDYETEIFTWIGHPKQCDDQVDVTAYAGICVSEEAGLSDIFEPYAVQDIDSPSAV